jgi:putative nucleotidyltransferase with HDIG domain
MKEATLFLVTDRPQGVRSLFHALRKAAHCRVVGPDVDWSLHRDVLAVVTDIDVGTLPGRTCLGRLKVSHATGMPPVIALLGEFSGDNALLAERLGATLCLSASLPERAILAGILDHAMPGTGMADRAHRRGIERAGEAVQAILRPLAPGEAFDMAPVEAGIVPILTAIHAGGLARWLDTVRAYDDATYQHCMLVAGLAASFAVGNGFPPGQQERLLRAALVHDVGKSAIPLPILNKPGRLEPDEILVMRTHPALGVDILRGGGCTDAVTLDATLHHHELMDGSGYPDGLSGEAISDVVRLLTVCDIYAALVERRPYRAPMPAPDAIGVLEGMGTRVEQGFVDAFARTVLRDGAQALAA